MRRENDGDRKGSGRLDSVNAQRRLKAFRDKSYSLQPNSLQPNHLCSYVRLSLVSRGLNERGVEIFK